MFMVRLLALALLCALPARASAQAWADAYRAGDYEKAADLLHLIVLESGLDAPDVDPEPHRHLAVMYGLGQGVSPDPIVECALAQMAGLAVHMRPGPPGEDLSGYQARTQANERFISDHCDALTRADRLAASRSLGCYGFGLGQQYLTAGDQSVSISHRGIGVAGSPAAAPLNCMAYVVRVRATTLEPPPDAAPGVKARHLLEVFSWYPRKDPKTAAMRFPIMWDVFEVLPGHVEQRLSQQEIFSSNAAPGRTLPAGADPGSVFEMIRSGHVRWKFDGAPPKRGWIMLGGENK